MMRKLGIAFGLTVATVVVTLWAIAGTTAPTPDFIVAALRDQQSARGENLEVEYQQVRLDKPDVSKVQVRYVWTPSMLYMDCQSPTYSRTASLDTNTGQYRLLNRGGKVTYGVVGQAPPGGPLANQNTMDPIVRPLDDSNILTVIGRGEVSPYEEEVEGNPCWRIESRATEPGFTRYVIWVDPELGFSIRKLEIDSADEKPVVTIFSQYTEVRTGSWFPMKTTTDVEWPRTWKAPRSVTIVEQASVLKSSIAMKPSDLDIVFPSGIKVIDTNMNAEYIQP